MVKRFAPILLAILALSILSSAARAETGGPVWKIISVTTPTNFKPGDESGTDAVMVVATNVGGASTGCTAAQIEAEKLREEAEAATGVSSLSRSMVTVIARINWNTVAPTPKAR